MAYQPKNPNGQATKANSSPVTLASDQNNALETGGNLATIATNTGSIPASPSTTALQTTGNISLSTIATNTGASATSANQTNGTQQTKITDGTNIGAVKAASTAPLATDPAQVVVISPNQAAFPTTANISALAGNSISTGNGVSNTGVARVAIVSNNSAVAGLGAGATGSAVPANAVYMGVLGSSGNLSGTASMAAETDAAAASGAVATGGMLFNGTNYDRQRSATSARATTGTGLLGVAALGQYNSTLPTVSTGNYEIQQADAGGRPLVTLGTKLDPTNDSITIGGGLMPTNTALNTYSLHSTTNATTTPTSSTAYISTIAISVEVVGTTSTVTIQDKSGTPLKLVPGVVSTATGLTVYNFQTPVKMTSGIDIVTAGVAAATVDVFINYFQ